MDESLITRNHSLGPDLRCLYESAFPEDECIPWDDLMRLVEQMPLEFTAYLDGGRLCGFTVVYPRPSFNWFWYFAVPDELRGHGIGQRILSQLTSKYEGQNCVLDMESPRQFPCPNLEQRKRRHAFYLRNGFRDTHVYRSYGEVEMTIMAIGPARFSIRDWDEMTEELKCFWWPKELLEE